MKNLLTILIILFLALNLKAQDCKFRKYTTSNGEVHLIDSCKVRFTYILENNDNPLYILYKGRQVSYARGFLVREEIYQDEDESYDYSIMVYQTIKDKYYLYIQNNIGYECIELNEDEIIGWNMGWE